MCKGPSESLFQKGKIAQGHFGLILRFQPEFNRLALMRIDSTPILNRSRPFPAFFNHPDRFILQFNGTAKGLHCAQVAIFVNNELHYPTTSPCTPALTAASG